jgi:hypothetical protein
LSLTNFKFEYSVSVLKFSFDNLNEPLKPFAVIAFSAQLTVVVYTVLSVKLLFFNFKLEYSVSVLKLLLFNFKFEYSVLVLKLPFVNLNELLKPFAVIAFSAQLAVVVYTVFSVKLLFFNFKLEYSVPVLKLLLFNFKFEYSVLVLKLPFVNLNELLKLFAVTAFCAHVDVLAQLAVVVYTVFSVRSEERRVGKEC